MQYRSHCGVEINSVSFFTVQAVGNLVCQDLRVNQQQDFPATPGETGGVGKSRGDTPYPTEWTMDWLVHTYKCILTMCVKVFPSGATPLCQQETVFGKQQ